jgi:hypothetical protein
MPAGTRPTPSEAAGPIASLGVAYPAHILVGGV